MASEKPVSTTRRAYTHRLSILLGVIVVLALGLGLGLGLGLKHHHHSDNNNGQLETLTPQTSSNFVVGSIIGEPSQERNYNFTIQAANGAPDGVNKTMLVVNGESFWKSHFCCDVPSGSADPLLGCASWHAGKEIKMS